MAVTVKVYGTLVRALGQSRLELDWAGGSLADFIERLAAAYGLVVREELLDEEGRLDYAYGVFNAGERLMDLAAPIRDGDELVVVSMLAGGSGCRAAR